MRVRRIRRVDSVLRIPKREPRIFDICTEKSQKYWNSQVQWLRDRTRRIGQDSKAFQESCRRLKELAGMIRAEGENLDRAIRYPLDIRACTYMWLEDDDFSRETGGVSRAPLSRFKQIRPKLGMAPFLHLLELFFLKFDSCGDLQALCGFVRAEFEHRAEKFLPENLARLKRNRQTIFQDDSYKAVARAANTKRLELYNLMQDMGIEPSQGGRFVELTAACHFLARIERLEAGGDDSVLAEVVKPNVAEVRYEGRFLGHFVIEKLVEIADRKRLDIPEKWLQSILAIAGDPRISKASARYLKWWAKIKLGALSAILKRLSGFDLKLFLEVLDDFAERSYDDDLRRMFPKRRRFLEGLLKQKLIRRARLFVSRDADSYLQRKYNQEELPNYALLNSPTTSVIYLLLEDTHNEAHIVEGSHMHRFWIYDKLPKQEPLTNYDRNTFERNKLSKGIETAYWDEYFSDEFPWYTAHQSNWQEKVILQLQGMGIRVDPELLLDREDYYRFRSKHGVQY